MKAAPLQLRPGVRADLAAICGIAKRETDALGFLPRAAYREYLGRRWVLVACDGNELAGFLVWRMNRRERVAKVMQVAVAPAHRGRGVAKALVRQLIDLAAFGGCERVSCWVLDKLPANGFWRAMGFEPGETKMGGKSRGRLLRQYSAVPRLGDKNAETLRTPPFIMEGKTPPSPKGITRRQAYACRGTYVEGRSTRELAREAGLKTPDAIRMRRMRARRRLAESGNPTAIRLAAALSLGRKPHRAVTFSLSFSDA